MKDDQQTTPANIAAIKLQCSTVQNEQTKGALLFAADARMNVGTNVKTEDIPGYGIKYGVIVAVSGNQYKVRWSDGFISGWVEKRDLKIA